MSTTNYYVTGLNTDDLNAQYVNLTQSHVQEVGYGGIINIRDTIKNKKIMQTNNIFLIRATRALHNFPIIFSSLALAAILSILSMFAYVFAGIKTVHPVVLLWTIIASAGLSTVVIIAAEEFSRNEKEEN